jgi:hypothetical protein
MKRAGGRTRRTIEYCALSWKNAECTPTATSVKGAHWGGFATEKLNSTGVFNAAN